jgi:hypothetical protein
MKHWFEDEKTARIFGEIILTFLTISVLIVLLTYAYIGTFTRYWADDFCFTQTLNASKNLLSATLNLYNTWSNRYTTMILVGISEGFGQKAISYLPSAMIALWAVGLISLLNQIKAALMLPRHLLSSLLSAFVLIFLTILQAPDRYQSVFWRSGMVTYFAPLVFFTFSAAFILNQFYKPGHWQFARQIKPGLFMLSSKQSLLPALLLVASLFFLSGGLSETTLAMQTGGLFLALGTVWLFFHGENRQRVLALLITGLIASCVSLGVVFLAPGNANRLTSMPVHPGLFDLAASTLRFAWDFIWQSLISLPIPTIMTLWLAILLSLDYFGRINRSENRYTASRLASLIIIIPLAAYALILCATAPSVYVYAKLGYPAARALFPSRFIMTGALFLDGILLGLMIHQLLPHIHFSKQTGLNLIVLLLLGATAFYPLRSAQKELATIPGYQKLAIEWDNRDAQVQIFKADHVKNIILDGIESPASLSELNPDPTHWVNRCVASFYDLETIAVFP